MKKFLSLLFVVIMLVTLVVPLTQTVSAATTVNETYVKNRITSLTKIFPTGSYFSANGKPCSSSCLVNGLSYSCQNCYLANIIKQNTTAKNAMDSFSGLSTGRYGCCAFAGYAFYYIFGHDPTSNSYNIISSDYGGINDSFLSQLRPGDYLRMNDGKHFAIFLGYDSNNIYLYHSNTTAPCQVQYNGARARTKYNLIKAYRSKNYSVPSTITPTITHGYSGNTDEITEKNAIVYGTVTKSSNAKVERFGIRIRKTTGTYENGWSYYHNSSSNYLGKSYVRVWFNFKDEVGVTLTPATSYTYQYYAKIDGQEYWSSEKSLTTKGSNSSSSSASISHGYTGSTDTITADNAVVYGTLNKSNGATVEKFGIRIKKTGGSYSTAWTYTHNPKSTYSSSTSVKFWYDIKEEMEITLTHLTSYTYQLYAKVNGVEYWSSEKSFTTTGTHTYGSWTTTKAATCTTAGIKTRKCSGCSQTETATIAATGHSYGAWTTTKAATCLNIGTQKRTCSTCSASETKNIAALGHNYSSEWTVDKQASCFTEGSKSHHCTRCSVKGSITAISATGHTFGEWQTVVAPTTTSNGTAKRTCANCTTTENKNIPAIAADGHTHNFGEWKVVEEANCKSVGTQERSCGICEAKETQEVSIKAHEFGEWSVKTAATEQAEGIEERKCNDCEYTETRGISKLPETIPEDSSQPSDINSSTPTDNNTTPKDNTLIYVIVVSLAVVLSTGIVMGTLLKIKKK